MGAIRGMLLVIVCIIIFFSFLIGNFLWTVSSSLEYNNVKSPFISLIGDIVEEQLSIEDKLNELSPFIESRCASNEEYAFDYGGSSISIPCSVFVSGTDAVISYAVTSFFEQYYYKEYNCKFWNCFAEGGTPLFFISQKAHDYWQGKFRLALLLSAILAGLIFLLAEKKSNSFILLGALIIASSFLLLKIENLAFAFSNSIGNLGAYASNIISIFFTQSNVIFTRVILIGILFLILGILLKIFHFGVVLSNFINKFKKNLPKGKEKIKAEKNEEKIVKEKVSKKKKK